MSPTVVHAIYFLYPIFGVYCSNGTNNETHSHECPHGEIPYQVELMLYSFSLAGVLYCLFTNINSFKKSERGLTDIMAICHGFFMTIVIVIQFIMSLFPDIPYIALIVNMLTCIEFCSASTLVFVKSFLSLTEEGPFTQWVNKFHSGLFKAIWKYNHFLVLPIIIGLPEKPMSCLLIVSNGRVLVDELIFGKDSKMKKIGLFIFNIRVSLFYALLMIYSIYPDLWGNECIIYIKTVGMLRGVIYFCAFQQNIISSQGEDMSAVDTQGTFSPHYE